ncbi:lantibiotic dehydratase [Corallococcus sp. M7]
MTLTPQPPMSTNHSRPPSKSATYAASGFFALRTPLLPFDTLVDWGLDLSAWRLPEGQRADALSGERARLRERLRKWVEEPVVREALFLASPGLEESIPVWLESPDSEWGQKVERGLVRYLSRMAGRATPFGLFAAHSVGSLSGKARLRVPERSAVRKHTRLDMDYVCALVEHVRREPEVMRALRYVPNTSLYRTPTELRYLEMRQRGRERSYGLVAVEPTPYLDATLEHARAGATLEALAQALVALDAEIPLEDARLYTVDLVEAQLLVPTWAPNLTGPEPVPFLLAGAEGIPALAPVRERLSAVQSLLADLDAAPPGASPASYRHVARTLEALPVPVELPRLFQVDSVRPVADLSLPSRVASELLRAVEVLRRITPERSEQDPLVRFRERFAARYEGRSVPLLEALDEERGIGFVADVRPGGGTGPLVKNLGLRSPRGADPAGLDTRARHLLRRLQEVSAAHAHELVLTDEDLRAMEAETPRRLANAFGVVSTLVADSEEAVDRGDFRILFENIHVAGAMYMGRFCHGDPDLEARVREHLRAEEALRPDAVFAEIVHLPQGRMGNVVCRPALRRHDLVFLGQSGVPEDDRIDVADLRLSLEGNRLVLRSERLGREVIPRLTNAHNFVGYGLSLYRFLCMMQNEGGERGMRFLWGPLDAASFLPRVRYGRTVLALACWNLTSPLLQTWGKLQGAARFDAVQRYRQEARLPRWVCLRDGDNQLPVDLDNVLSVETLVHTVKERPLAVLEELYPGPEGLCVEGGDGRYVHEVVVPFVREPSSMAPPQPELAPAPPAQAKRRFPPGSEWLYLKLYTGTATADRLLRGGLGDTVRQVLASGAVDRWFFIRYGDPDFHLRLRFHGDPARLESQVWPVLRSACADLLDEGTGWKLQLDTYEREVERYGGPVGVVLSEAFFSVDSDATLDLLRTCEGDAGADLRWRLVLKGLDLLLTDLGLPLTAKARVAERARDGFAAEFKPGKVLETQLSARFRAERPKLEALLDATPATEGPWREGLTVLQQRSERLATVGREFQAAEREGRLTLPVEALATSLMHMHVNRVLPDDARAHELVLYDFLARLYRSRLARG